MSSAAEPRQAVILLGSIDASGPEDIPVFVASVPIEVLGVDLIDTAAKSGHGTNKGTYSILNKGAAGSGTAVVATRVTDTPTTDDIAAFVRWPITLSATKSLLEVAAGSVLSFTASEAGAATSGDLTNAALVIEYAVGYSGGV